MPSFNRPRFDELLPAFKEKFLGPPGQDHYARDWFDKNPEAKVPYQYKQRVQDRLTDDHLYEHFKQVPHNRGGFVFGSFAVKGVYLSPQRKKIIKRVAWDADSEEQTAKLYKLKPTVEKYGIDHLIEYGGENFDRRKLWVFFDNVDFDLANIFVNQIMKEAGVTNEDFGGEVYPITRPNGIIRIPLGYHSKRKNVFPVEINGELTIDPIAFMEAVIAMKAVTEDDLKAWVRNVPLEKKEVKQRADFNETRWLPMDLPIENGLPTVVKTICQQCPAFNKMLEKIKNESILNDTSGLGHNVGLRMAGLALYNDYRTKGTDGEEWFEDLLAEYRKKEYKHHDWYWYRNQPKRQIASCKTYEQEFGWCEGCLQKDRNDFYTPKQFWHSKPITKTKVAETKLTTVEKIRAEVFTSAAARVVEAIETEESATIRLMSPQESGKSHFTDQFIADLVKNKGYSVVISVPTGQLAVERKRRLKQLFNIDAFCMMSQENLMEYIANFECPDQIAITEHRKLGIKSHITKKQFCKACPLKDDCPYPKQYKRAKDPGVKVLILQHAHMNVEVARWQLFDNGRFQLLVLDETFIDHTYEYYKAKPEELALLQAAGWEWTDKLYSWLSGEGARYADGDIEAPEVERRELYDQFEEKRVPWRINEFISMYEEKRYCHITSGIFKFHRVPDIPVKLITDATTPNELYEIVLDTKIETFGGGEIIDYRRFNPHNQIIQVIDSSVSVTALGREEEDLLYAWLQFIGDTCRREHPNQQILITPYKAKSGEIKTWMRENYPDVMDRANLNALAVGTNEFEMYPVQFLMAGFYFNGDQYRQFEWQLKQIEDFWIAHKGMQPNKSYIFPWDTYDREADPKTGKKKVSSVPTESHNLTIIEPEGTFTYDITVKKPRNWYHRKIQEFNFGRTQQAGRIRFFKSQTENKEEQKKLARWLYVLGNVELPSMMVTKVLLRDMALGYQYKTD